MKNRYTASLSLASIILLAAACSPTGPDPGDPQGSGASGSSDTGGAPGLPDGTGAAAASGGVGAGTASGGAPAGTGGVAPGSGGTSGTVGCAGADIFCEDFEAIGDGEIPTGNGWSTRDASCGSMSFAMGVSGDNPRGASSKALKVTNHSYAQCRLSRAFETKDEFWVTAHVYWDPAVDFAGKEILAMDLHPDSGLGKDDPAVRFGSRSKEPCTASPGPQITMIGLGGGEVTGCNDATPIPKGEWYCFEAHVRQPDSLTVKTYINSTELMYQSSGKPLVSELVSAAVPSEKINNLRLGMFTHNSTGAGDVYVDDVSVSTTRVGCN